MALLRDIRKFTRGRYDVLVIGGGINGAGIAHMAALNGLKTALLEKNDFASGTSSKSTKLIHGGLRYLENLEFGLVRESLKERFIQLKSAPHLVRPLKFVIPVYKSDKRPFWAVRCGLRLYDRLSGKYVIEKHRALSIEEVCRLVPGIRRDGLLGGIAYSDAQMNDARLCLENVLSAVEKGADAANYAQARALIRTNGRVAGVRAYDCLNQETFDVRAKKVVCALGPWTNVFAQNEDSRSPPPVRTTKGIHIVYRGRLARHAVLIPARRDRRVLFIIPWMGNSLIGTTDTDFTGHPDHVTAAPEDIDYLVGEVGRVLPHADLSRDNIIMTFAGLRALVRERGSPERVSRRHVIRESRSGLIYVLGGKYTTYRKIAEDVVRRLIRKPPADTREGLPVYGSGAIDEDPAAVARKYSLEPHVVRSLMDFYGTRFRDVLAFTDQDPGLREPVCACSPVIRAQILYAIRAEMARTEEDIVMRRLVLGYNGCPSGKCREAVRRILSETVR